MQIVLLSFTVCSITKIQLPFAVRIRLVEDSDTPLLFTYSGQDPHSLSPLKKAPLSHSLLLCRAAT